MPGRAEQAASLGTQAFPSLPRWPFVARPLPISETGWMAAAHIADLQGSPSPSQPGRPGWGRTRQSVGHHRKRRVVRAWCELGTPLASSRCPRFGVNWAHRWLRHGARVFMEDKTEMQADCFVWNHAAWGSNEGLPSPCTCSSPRAPTLRRGVKACSGGAGGSQATGPGMLGPTWAQLALCGRRMRNKEVCIIS